jgi:nucleoside-diphosphate-sugar epimerase
MEVAVMKIVVIGGSGLIGSKLVGKLREQGHEPWRRHLIREEK